MDHEHDHEEWTDKPKCSLLPNRPLISSMPLESEKFSGSVVYHPIGMIKNDFREKSAPKEIRNSTSTLLLDERFVPALEGLDRFKYLIVIYHLHLAQGYQEKVHPMGNKSIPKRGVLATRSPSRPNPIAVTVAELIKIDRNRITVTGLDALDGTPILDIKPYEEHFDSPQGLLRERDPCYQPQDQACL
jgi:tRNA-Thr(GGU) m(6)t(6)A37 methyltransferase TsaA